MSLASTSPPLPMAAGDVSLLQIVPPGHGGVCDFAHLLQQRWADLGLTSRLEAYEATQAARVPLARLLQPMSATPSRDGRAAVLLHYSGYGYQPRGVPVWLVRQIEAARRELGPRLHLVSYFHETHASGPPWRSAFWLSWLQARVAGQLARLSDAVCTNASPHGRWLVRAVGRGSQTLRVRPVFATIGEPEPAQAALPEPAREPVAVVFGAASTRSRALLASGHHIDRLRRLGVERLVEVGSGAASTAPAGLPLQFLGRLEPPALHRLLLRSRFGLIDYPSSLLGKSSVFAALAAHGLVILNTRPFDGDTDGLRQGHHYLSLGLPVGGPSKAVQPAKMAAAVRQWYLPHSSQAQALDLAALLGGHALDTSGSADHASSGCSTAHIVVSHG